MQTPLIQTLAYAVSQLRADFVAFSSRKLEALGVVRGSTVQSRNLGHDMMAGFRTLVGGEVTDYADMLTEARQITTGRMVKDAEALGADAIVGMRYASASVMQGAAEVIAYGTAVKFV